MLRKAQSSCYNIKNALFTAKTGIVAGLSALGGAGLGLVVHSVNWSCRWGQYILENDAAYNCSASGDPCPDVNVGVAALSSTLAKSFGKLQYICPGNFSDINLSYLNGNATLAAEKIGWSQGDINTMIILPLTCLSAAALISTYRIMKNRPHAVIESDPVEAGPYLPMPAEPSPVKTDESKLDEVLYDPNPTASKNSSRQSIWAKPKDTSEIKKQISIMVYP